MGDETMKAPEPQKEHEWLQKLVGDWTFEIEAAEPGQASTKSEGFESVRSLGGLWTLAEGRSPMPDGSDATSVMTLGYDPQKKRFVGTFVASMMTYLWIYEGELDEAGRVLTLDAEGPGMSADGKMVKYKDRIELMSDDHRVLSSSIQGEDGNWTKFMTAHYRRQRK